MRAYIWGIRIILLVAVITSLVASAIIVTSTATLNGQGTIGVQGNPPAAFLATGSLLTLAFTYVTGFSIGRGYFPASVLLLLSLAATAFHGTIRRQPAR